jgi:thiol-disulfide isomerase/thioredoxin
MNAESVPEKHKPTSSPRHAWVTLALVVIVSSLFGLIVLPKLGGRGSSLQGLPAPDFNLEVIAGGEAGNRIHLGDLVGKAVVLDFWASWCGPCRQQAPIVEAFSKAHSARDVVVVGVNTSDTRADALEYLRSTTLSYAMALDEDGKVAMAYGVKTLPTVVVVGKSGKITAVRQSVVRRSELEDLVSRANAQ